MLKKPVYRIRNGRLLYEIFIAYKCNNRIKRLLTYNCKNTIKTREKLRKGNFRFTQCNKEGQGTLQYTEKTSSVNHLKTMAKVKVHPDAFFF
jgi:hypothetical protein